MVYLHLYAFVLDKPFWLFPVLTSCDLLSYRTMGKKVPAANVRVYGKTTPKTAPKSVAKKGKDGKDVKPKNDKKVKKPVERKKDAKKDKKEKKDKEKEKGKEKPVKRRKVHFDPTPVVVRPPPKGKDAKGEKTNKEEKPKDTRRSALKSPPCTPLKGNLAMVTHESQSPGDESASPSALGRDLEELERDKKAARKAGLSLAKFLAEKSEKAVEEHMQQLLKEAEAKQNESSAETEAEEDEEEEPEEESEGNSELEVDEDQKEEENEDAETDSSSDSAVEDSSDSSSEEEEEEKEEKPGKSPKIVEKPKQSSEVAKAEACAAAVEKEAIKQKANSIWS